MSHFSVLVATAEHPSEDVLNRELQPFHEFGCTGTDDQYVQDIDQTEWIRAEFEDATTTRYRDCDGTLRNPYEDRFYRDPTADESKQIGPLSGTGCGNAISWTSRDWGDGRGYRPKVHFCPEGMQEIEVPRRDVEPFAEYVSEWHGKSLVKFGESPDLTGKHKYGYALLSADGNVAKIIDRTNPNHKWDYWRVGGRYTGKLQGRGGSQAPASYEWGMDNKKPPAGLDICQKKNLDVEFMKAVAVRKRREWVDECCEKASLTFVELGTACRECIEGHGEWMKLAEPRPRGADYRKWLGETGRVLGATAMDKCWELPEPIAGQSLREWIGSAPYLTSFAFLREGKWAAEGDMGWWACVSNENANWERD